MPDRALELDASATTVGETARAVFRANSDRAHLARRAGRRAVAATQRIARRVGAFRPTRRVSRRNRRRTCPRRTPRWRPTERCSPRRNRRSSADPTPYPRKYRRSARSPGTGSRTSRPRRWERPAAGGAGGPAAAAVVRVAIQRGTDVTAEDLVGVASARGADPHAKAGRFFALVAGKAGAARVARLTLEGVREVALATCAGDQDRDSERDEVPDSHQKRPRAVRAQPRGPQPSTRLGASIVARFRRELDHDQRPAREREPRRRPRRALARPSAAPPCARRRRGSRSESTRRARRPPRLARAISEIERRRAPAAEAPSATYGQTPNEVARSGSGARAGGGVRGPHPPCARPPPPRRARTPRRARREAKARRLDGSRRTREARASGGGLPVADHPSRASPPRVLRRSRRWPLSAWNGR